MDVIFKAFSGLFFLVVLMITGISLLFSSIGAANADSFATSVAGRIRASYFNSEVIEQCKKEADELDYKLEVSLYTDENTHERYGVADLAYVYSIPLFGIEKTFHVTSEMF